MDRAVACISQFPLRATPPPGVAIGEPLAYRNPYPLDSAELAVADFVVTSVGLEAAERGCDAILVNTLADYGVDHLRRFLAGPIVGAGEAAYAAALSLGRRFSIVSVWPAALDWVQRRRLAAAGVADRCVSLRSVTSETDVRTAHDRRQLLAETQSCSVTLVERLADELQRVVEDGADVVVLGCTCMSAIGEMLAPTVGVPIVDPEAAGLALAAHLAARHGPLAFREGAEIDDVPIARLVQALGRSAAASLA